MDELDYTVTLTIGVKAVDAHDALRKAADGKGQVLSVGSVVARPNVVTVPMFPPGFDPSNLPQPIQDALAKLPKPK